MFVFRVYIAHQSLLILRSHQEILPSLVNCWGYIKLLVTLVFGLWIGTCPLGHSSDPSETIFVIVSSLEVESIDRSSRLGLVYNATKTKITIFRFIPTIFTFVPEKIVYDFQKPVFGDSSFEDVAMQIVCTERHIRIRFLDSAEEQRDTDTNEDENFNFLCYSTHLLHYPSLCYLYTTLNLIF